MTPEFKLDKRLAADTIPILDWPLCRVLLMNDQQYPWCILVPRVLDEAGEEITELFHLNAAQRAQLDKESNALSTTLMSHFSGYKLNVAALGNVVSQLHIHHVVRFQSDPSWPAPIWGRLPIEPYSSESAEALASELKSKLATLA